MKRNLAIYAAAIALSAAATLTAQAAGRGAAHDRSENQITAQLNRQQAQGNAMANGVEAYQGIVVNDPRGNRAPIPEQIAQPPADTSDLSIIE